MCVHKKYIHLSSSFFFFSRLFLFYEFVFDLKPYFFLAFFDRFVLNIS